MADHEEPYKKYEGEGGRLMPDCGHHCGIVQVGHASTHEAHCYCAECHGPKKVVTKYDPDISALSMNGDGIDPGGIS